MFIILIRGMNVPYKSKLIIPTFYAITHNFKIFNTTLSMKELYKGCSFAPGLTFCNHIAYKLL